MLLNKAVRIIKKAITQVTAMPPVNFPNTWSMVRMIENGPLLAACGP